MKKIIFSILALAAMATSVTAQAAKTEEQLPPAVKLAVSGGMRFEKSFPAPGNMTGWILSQGLDSNLVVYTTANGEVTIAGTMLDAKGQNITKQHLEQFAPKPDFDKMWLELDKSSWAAEGAKGKDVKSTIYVFLDPNCSYCHLAWKALQPYTKVGLSVRWVPVAFLAADSTAKAAAILNAKDPEAAILDLQANWGQKTAALPPVSPEMKAKVDANNKLMQNWGFRGTPAIFYKDAKTGKVKSINGMPKLSDLPDVTNLPAQVNTDPDLVRFK